ncbi:Plasmodium vivax Vir protein, putative [Plasmodium vivax]|uniref:Vir protein, putative n=1 Tax=Plasmodium vivax TaxID=5855 RepID=A0A1G4ECA0_PLAVI|nr:Plasmodium vivax Vir protein, putative [Plasmodium vivax]
MCSTQGPIVESYEFFEKIQDYIQEAKSAESNAESHNAEDKCNSFMISSGRYFTDKERAKIICKQFIKLYDSLTDCKINSNTNYKKCSDFLNYWVNFKLRKIMKGEDNCVSHVYDLLESQFTADEDFNINIDNKYIYNINEDDLHKMNILYSLYEKYTDISAMLENTTSRDKELLLSLSNASCKVYHEANYMCNDDNNNSKFCQELNKFESKYNELDGKVREQASELSDYFIRLSECPNTKIISTAVTGTIVGLIPLLGVLYKFTPMGQVLRSKMGILNNNISNTDEDTTNISLMEQENEPIKFQQGTYNIKYQSL